MLNEPFRILDNIPLIWCFASFETYQSRLLEIVTQTQGLADAPQPTQQVFSVLSAFTGQLVYMPSSSIFDQFHPASKSFYLFSYLNL